MLGKISFAVGILLFLVATGLVLVQGFHHAPLPQATAPWLQQWVEMAKELWLPETFALAFILTGGGLLLWWKDSKPE